MRISTSQFQRTSLSSILERQTKLAKLQQQLGSGRRILTPSDDPAGAAQALQLANKISQLERLQANANLANNRLTQEESTLEQVGTLIHRVHELAVAANNDHQSAADRKLIATELRERFEELLQLANATDGNGEYLFAGVASRDAPFLVSGDRQVTYVGDQTERFLQIGPARQLAVNHTGFDVFMRIPQGNGHFVTTADPANTGTGVIDNGQVLDPAALTGDSYEISFTRPDPDADELEYTVLDSDGNIVAQGVYESGAAIEFDGIAFTITGEPVPGDGVVPGDIFTVTPAGPRSLFATLDDLISALETMGDTPVARARLHNVVNSSLANLDHARENILRVRAEVGSRLHAIEAETAGNEDSTFTLQSVLSQIQDLDYAEAISEFNLKLVGYQAAQQSYMRVQGLSLFNLL